jgi:hypothetical protein
MVSALLLMVVGSFTKHVYRPEGGGLPYAANILDEEEYEVWTEGDKRRIVVRFM